MISGITSGAKPREGEQSPPRKGPSRVAASASAVPTIVAAVAESVATLSEIQADCISGPFRRGRRTIASRSRPKTVTRREALKL